MKTTQWEVANHEVVLEHSTIFGNATLLIDGKPVFHRGITFRDYGFAHRFVIENIPCTVVAQKHQFVYRYDLLTGDAADAFLDSNTVPAIESDSLRETLPIVGVVAWIFLSLWGAFILSVYLITRLLLFYLLKNYWITPLELIRSRH